MNEPRNDMVWKSPVVVEKFLQGIRGAIPYGKEQLDVMMRLIDAGETAVTSFLDLGCGSGVLGAVILERYPEAKGVFLDFSRPMLDAARETVGESGASVFVESDYGQSGWTEKVRELGLYDAVVSGYSIHHQPDDRKRELYEEILDLLRPGGIFVNVEHVEPACPLTETIFEQHFVDSLYAQERDMGGARSREQMAMEFFNREDKVANILAPVETQCAWLRDLGYADVDCYFKAYELAVFAGRRPDDG